MTNTYLSDEIWNQKRDDLAASILVLQAAKLIKARDADPALVDAARELATAQMAEIGLMPECTREAEPDHATIKFGGLTAVVPIDIDAANLPVEKIEAIVHSAMRNVAETFMHSYRAGRPAA